MPPVRFGVYSGDPLLVERKLEERLAPFAGFPRIVLFGDETPAARIVEAVNTPDLFAEARAIVVRWADPLRGDRALARELGRGLPPGVALFFLGEDLRGPLGSAAEEAHHFGRPAGRELKALVEELLREAGVPHHGFLVDLLAEEAGENTLILAQEVEKLALWKGGRLPKDRIPEVLFATQPAPYGLLDLLGRERLGALAELGRLLQARWNPQTLFNFVVAHIRTLLVTLSTTEAGGKAPGPDWLIRRRLAQARAIGGKNLIRALCLLQELDLQVKRGRISPEEALYSLILQWPGP